MGKRVWGEGGKRPKGFARTGRRHGKGQGEQRSLGKRPGGAEEEGQKALERGAKSWERRLEKCEKERGFFLGNERQTWEKRDDLF